MPAVGRTVVVADIEAGRMASRPVAAEADPSSFLRRIQAGAAVAAASSLPASRIGTRTIRSGSLKLPSRREAVPARS